MTRKISASEKASRTVKPTVAAPLRQTTVKKATSRVAARSAVTGRYVAEASAAKAAGKSNRGSSNK
ncbi:hypothetical protein [Intrasporangium chromatireducens]|uniref:hypothetical protein n=1 Tax=Intrasporangium chromatireducens TaxID=1386088 RepID=UPI00138E4F43|nr:hypothetical protein [Intrasporangium chromatireducens]